MKVMTTAALLLCLSAATVSAQARTSTQLSAGAQGGVQTSPTWGPAPAILPAGAKMAVLQGDPTKAEEFVVRLRFPNGYKIAPHTHPTDENITVISGEFSVGMGPKFERGSMKTLTEGGFVTAPANQAHYASARGITIVEIHAMGPFALTYVNPADAPKVASAK